MVLWFHSLLEEVTPMSKSSRFRPTLSDTEADMVIVALRQYAAGRVSPERKEAAYRLIDRLIDRQRGNPQFGAGYYRTRSPHK